jgi:ribose 5-phosphate isomerase A
MDVTALKRAAARAALDELVPGAVVAVGSGTTVDLLVDELAARRGSFPGAVCSSERTAARLRARGIAVLELNEAVASGQALPVYVDGADELDPRLRMIKGGGGALTREKIVASACARFVCIADGSKLVEALGRRAVPVEVLAFAREWVAARLRALGGAPRLREGFTSDEGNPILDVAGLPLADPAALERELEGWPGVVTCGLFARRGADVALVAAEDGVRRITPGGQP